MQTHTTFHDAPAIAKHIEHPIEQTEHLMPQTAENNLSPGA